MNHDIEDMVGQSTDASAEVISKQNSDSPDIEPGNLFNANDLGILNEVSITLSIEIGRAQIKIRDLLNLTKDSIIDLNKLAGEPVDIYANGKLISKGNIITANGKYCVRLLSIPNTK
ncbi:MAG: FliM/FliN family flagellar motor switch protein [Gammaproteobacteria bacterium]|nr:FliM/FliN family flagellar motor switch protein [Gammaproteobacteria bacterium]